jgi:DNA repair protein RecO (recombination protein O)
VDDRALVLRSVPVGEADLVVTLLTASRGVLAASARGARRSARRFGALEPMHELAVTFDLLGGDVARLVEARIDRLRLRLAADLARLDAAGRLLRWTRRAAPPGVPEPDAFEVVSGALEALDAPGALAHPRSILAAAGLELLEALGWGVDLERCVACGRVCPPGAAGSIDPVRGGLVCRACGGARRVWSGELRAAVLAARSGGAPLPDPAADVVLEVVEAVLDAHVAAPARPAAGPLPPGSRGR